MQALTPLWGYSCWAMLKALFHEATIPVKASRGKIAHEAMCMGLMDETMMPMPTCSNEPHHFKALGLLFITDACPNIICAWSCVFLFPVSDKVSYAMSIIPADRRLPLLQDPSPSKQLAEERVGRLQADPSTTSPGVLSIQEPRRRLLSERVQPAGTALRQCLSSADAHDWLAHTDLDWLDCCHQIAQQDSPIRCAAAQRRHNGSHNEQVLILGNPAMASLRNRPSKGFAKHSGEPGSHRTSRLAASALEAMNQSLSAGLPVDLLFHMANSIGRQDISCCHATALCWMIGLVELSLSLSCLKVVCVVGLIDLNRLFAQACNSHCYY